MADHQRRTGGRLPVGPHEAIESPVGVRTADLIGVSLDDSALPRNEVLSSVAMNVMAERAFEGADIRVGRQRLRAFARGLLARLHREPLQGLFTFDQPDQHLSLLRLAWENQEWALDVDCRVFCL